MIPNIREKITRRLLSLVRTPPLFNLYYRHHLPLPSVIMIENTNCCNAHCVMCPRETLTRKCGFMEFGLFEKIIKEVSGAARKPVSCICTGMESRCWMNHCRRGYRLAKASGIRDTDTVVTNALLLFPETSRKIISAGLDRMKISFYGTDEESYRATMEGLDFGVAVHNVQEFVRIRKGLRKRNPKLILQYLPQESNKARTREFRSLWRSVLNHSIGDRLSCSSLHNYGGGRAYNRTRDRIASVCFYPWSAMSVLWDGRTVTCCMDYNGVQETGDLRSQSVTEIWNGPVMSATRKRFGKQEYDGYPACLQCDWVHRR